jgi:hypothetical protein
LATFLGDASAKIVLGSLKDRRSYLTTATAADAVLLNTAYEPAKTLGWESFEDHVRATGSVTPTLVNPHGLSSTDIGSVAAAGSINYTTFSSISVGPNVVFDTTYQNTYAYPIGVSAICLGTSYTLDNAYANDAAISLLVGSTSPPTIEADYFSTGVDITTGGPTSGSVMKNVFAIIPSGWYYQITGGFNVDYSGPTLKSYSAGKVISTIYYLTPT